MGSSAIVLTATLRVLALLRGAFERFSIPAGVILPAVPAAKTQTDPCAGARKKPMQ
ncbi:hypothetical protein [Pseudomonas sp. LFM046]|uniref:hypothetical protein n=1 Tax=Pseudomonas sp. LFM046 TaxID=1608357 RepID=UPI000A5B037A|nr:hypothetical protein [Pseudomonas sp. LFM046]